MDSFSCPTSFAFRLFLLSGTHANKMPPIDSSLIPSLPPSSFITFPGFSSPPSMALELQKPRITEIHVRMDCNGCVQKIKKALHGISGIYNLDIDFPQQKLTITGWADPDKIVKAIKKTRKIATICSHIEQPTESAPPPLAEQQQPPPEGGAASPPDAANPPPAESPPPAEPTTPPPEAVPPAGPPKDPPPLEHPPPPEAESSQPTPVAAEANLGQQHHPVYNYRPPRDVGEVHTIYHHQPDYGYGYGYTNGYTNGYSTSGYPGYYNRYQTSQVHHHPPGPTPPPAQVQAPPPAPSPPVPVHVAVQAAPSPPVYVTHSYNTHRPSPYVTEYEYIQPPPPQQTHYNRINQYHNYNEDHQSYQPYHNVSSYRSGNGNITSIFSDENPNACVVM